MILKVASAVRLNADVVRPKIGWRIFKTAIAIMLSIALARLFHLATPQFAGIIAVLAVRPSVTKSVRDGLRQLISALIGAAVGVVVLYLLGSSVVVVAATCLVLMGLHARWGWTSTLLVAVVSTLNTMDGTENSYISDGFNEVSLMLIGIGCGTIINLLFKSSNGPRSKSLLSKSERDVFRLLKTIQRDLERGKATPYLVFRRSLDEVRRTLELGQQVSNYAYEDRRYHSPLETYTLDAFHVLESLVERTRDMNRSLQQMNASQDCAELARLINLIAMVQKRMVTKRECHFSLVEKAIDHVEETFHNHFLPSDNRTFVQRATEYHLFLHVKEYFWKLSELRGNVPEPLHLMSTG